MIKLERSAKKWNLESKLYRQLIKGTYKTVNKKHNKSSLISEETSRIHGKVSELYDKLASERFVLYH